MAMRFGKRPRRDRPLAGQRRRRAIKATASVLPTLLTLGNLLSGGVAIFLASRPTDVELPWGWSALTFAAACIFLGMVFDGLDGRIARMTGSTSDLGEQLDSMADMVTFGVAPAFLAVQLVGIGTPFLSEKGDHYFDRVALIIAGIYVACTALRLARFNIEVNQPSEADHSSFKGLPSPGAAGAVASVVLLHQLFLARPVDPGLATILTEIGMVLLMLLVALAMVGRLRYVHVLNRYFRNNARFGTLVRIVIFLMLLMIYPQAVIAAAFVGYALSAPGWWLWQKWIQLRRTPPAKKAT
jgi:CDP-diacylglycerol--serine O-phosphatidyltransferase